MAATDVVKHDLPKLLDDSEFDWTEDVEPLPLPLVSGPERVAAPVNPPTTSMITNRIIKAPYHSVGKMWMKFPNLRSSGATGWVVAPRAFITAGHCVYAVKHGGWITEASFCPRFNNACAAGIYRVKTVFTLQGFLDEEQSGDTTERQYDMAACLVTKTFHEKEPPLSFVVDSPPARQYAAIGYPIRPKKHAFNGMRMWQALGDWTLTNDGMIYAATVLGGGASGGPWCDPENDWVVSGLTSGRFHQDPNVRVSPVFGQGFQNLYNAVKNFRGKMSK